MRNLIYRLAEFSLSLGRFKHDLMVKVIKAQPALQYPPITKTVKGGQGVSDTPSHVAKRFSILLVFASFGRLPIYSSGSWLESFP